MVILPEGICGKVKGFGDGRTGGTAEPEPEEFDANSPGPLGFRSAVARFVRPLGRSPATTFASFLAVRLADRETELTIPSLISL